MSKRLIALLLIFLTLVLFAAWQWHEFVLGRPNRVALLKELQPVALKNCILKRFGSANDGGYLLCDNLSNGIQSAYSYGVGPNDEFGCDVSKRYGVPVHQYDCFDPARPTCHGGVFVFHNQCIGPRPERDKNQRVFDTLENQIFKNHDTGKRLIVKIDVEGAEWDSLLATPDAVLDQIDQMPMELHLPHSPYLRAAVVNERHLQVIKKLKQKFYVVNLHFNNDSCTPFSAPLPAWAFQVLLVNKRVGVLDQAAPTPAPMSALNAPDYRGGPDCQPPSDAPETPGRVCLSDYAAFLLEAPYETIIRSARATISSTSVLPGRRHEAMWYRP